MLTRQLCLLMGAALLCGTAAAGDPRPGDPDYVDIAAPSGGGFQISSHSGSSGFEPPEENDTTFVVDTGPGLDTGCTFRSGGPLVFEILIDRAFEDDVETLKRLGRISEKATLSMPAFDVDSDGGGSSFAPERDRVTFNGNVVPGEFLQGGNNVWRDNAFQLPIEWVKFREPGAGVAPARNVIRIDIDTANSEEVWCTSIDWAALTFRAARPVVMAHGILSDNSVWNTVWVPSLAADAIPASSSINPNMGNLDSIQNNAGKIEAAVELAKERWGVDKVNLVTHSKGGLDSRDFVERSDSVAQLVQLGTPNAGSPLADYAQGVALGAFGILGRFIINELAGPAGKQLTTDHMALYNRNHGHNPDVQYLAVAGVYTPDCTFCWDSVANRIVGAGDLIVPRDSVHALGYMSQGVVTSGGANRDATHTQIQQSAAVYSGVIDANWLTILTQRAPASHVPGDTQRSESALGTISAGQLQFRPVVVDESNAIVSMLYPEGELQLVLVSPSGRRIDPVVADAETTIDFADGDIPGGRMAAYSLQDAERGTWTVEVSATAGAEVDYAITAWIPDAHVTIQHGFARQSIAAGEDLILQATLREEGVPVLGAFAYAMVAAPDGSLTAVTLLDDGSNGDETAADGVYSGTHPSASQAGMYQALLIAEGTSADGHAFSRETYGLATVSEGQAQVVAFRDAGVDTNGNGFFDELIVEADLRVDFAGQYHVLAVLSDSAGNTHQASVRQNLDAGDNTVALSFDGSDIYSRRVDGPYVLSMLRAVQERDFEILPVIDLQDAHATSAYVFGAFEHERIQFLGTGTSVGVDTDGNGLFDSLDIGLDVDLAQSGSYQWSAQLTDGTGTTLGFFAGSGFLQAGTRMFVFSFPGEAIGKNGEDGPYFITGLLVRGGGASLALAEAFTTEPFLASQFEGYANDFTPPVLKLSADPRQLWPPNHRMVPVTIKVDVQDDQDPQPTVRLISVTSNESDNGLGDGDMANDIQDASIGTDDRNLTLRAERSGTGTGRVYTLTYEARDAAGNTSTATVTVAVPLARN